MPIDPRIPLGGTPVPFNNPFEVLAQMQQIKGQQQAIKSNQALEQTRLQDIEKQRREEEAQRRFYAIIASSRDPDDAEQRIQAEAPEFYAPYREQRLKVDKAAQELSNDKLRAKELEANIAKKGQEYAEPFLMMVERSGYDPKVFDFAIGTIASHFPEFPADQLRQAAGGGPQAIKQIVDGFKSPQQQNADVTATKGAAELPGIQADAAIKQQVAAGTMNGLTPDQQRQGAQSAATLAQQKAMAVLNASEAARHNRATEAKTGQGESGAGWSIQQASDPATNTTQMVRVNSRTGEVQPVKLPGDLQAGGQRQTRLTAGQQEDLATMATVQDLSKQLLDLGEATKWSGVGGLGAGTVGEFAAKQFGLGTSDAVKLRALIGNVKGTIAKLRGGASFTEHEQKMLDTYVPGINETPLTIKAKISGLNDFIETKRKNTMQFAGADTGTPKPKTGGIKILKIEQVP